MASIKISELNEYTEVQENDLFVVVDVNNEETKQEVKEAVVTKSDVKESNTEYKNNRNNI